MTECTIELELLSDTLINSGEGFGAIIDSDIVFDDIGIPYIPAKRIKGCLRDAAREACVMLDSAGIDKKAMNRENEYVIIETAFGKSGDKESAPVFFSNLMIKEYETNQLWLKYLAKTHKVLSRDSIISTFTTIRQQTAVDDDGVADPHSLRTIRVLEKRLCFNGTVRIFTDDPDIIKILALGCLNLRHIGTKRNRGFGEVACKLYEGNTEVHILHELEALCTK